MNRKENKLLVLDDIDIKSIKEIGATEYNVAVINSIAVKYKELRTKSKAPTFALT